MAIHSMAQLVALARYGGWSGNDVPIAAAVAMAESSGNDKAINHIPCVGLWQVNAAAHRQHSISNLYDPKYNARAAYQIWRAQGWSRGWTAYSNGSYRKFLSKAVAAAGSTTGSIGVGSTPTISVPNPSGRTTFKGHTVTNLYAEQLKKIEAEMSTPMIIFQGGFRPRTDYSGTSHQGDALDWGPNTKENVNIARKYGNRAWRRGPGFPGKMSTPHIHMVPMAGYGYAAGSGAQQALPTSGDGLGGPDFEDKINPLNPVEVGGAIGGHIKTLTSLNETLAALQDPELWKRLAYILVGIVCILIAVVSISATPQNLSRLGKVAEFIPQGKALGAAAKTVRKLT